VNGQLLISDWVPHGPIQDNSSTTAISLVAGQYYPIIIQYFENDGGASIQLSYSSACVAKTVVPQTSLYSNTGNGLTGSYYNGSSFNTFVASRVDPTINLNFGLGSPNISTVGTDNFSVRWGGFIVPPCTAVYTFYIASDDGEQLWVNGQQLINNWNPHGAIEDTSTTISLSAGQFYPILIQYFEIDGGASIKLSWSSSCVAKSVVPQASLYSQ